MGCGWHGSENELTMKCKKVPNDIKMCFDNCTKPDLSNAETCSRQCGVPSPWN
jgi:hypothetical protein